MVILDMKYLQTQYSQNPTATVYHKDISRRVDGVPTWQFSNCKCDICKQDIRQQTGHGTFTDECTILQLNGYDPMPVHTDCLNKKLEKDAQITVDYWDAFDFRHKQLHSQIDRIVREFGWKDFYFAAKEYNEKKEKSNYKIPTV